MSGMREQGHRPQAIQLGKRLMLGVRLRGRTTKHTSKKGSEKLLAGSGEGCQKGS